MRTLTAVKSGRTRTTLLHGAPLPWLPVADDNAWETAATALFGELVASTGRAVDPARTARELRVTARDAEPGEQVIASLTLEQHWPQLIVVEAAEPALEVDPAVLAGAAAAGPFGLPEVEIGAGSDETMVAVTTRRDLLDDGSVSIAVCVVRRSFGLDVRVLWRTTALELVDSVRSELVALSSAVRMEAA